MALVQAVPRGASGVGRPNSKISIWFQENDSFQNLYFDAPGRNHMAICRTDVRTEELQKKSRQLRASIATLTRQELKASTLQEYARQVTQDTEATLRHLLDQCRYDPLNPAAPGDATAYSQLIEEIERQLAKACPVDVYILNAHDYIPWEVLQVHHPETGELVRLCDVAWITRVHSHDHRDGGPNGGGSGGEQSAHADAVENEEIAVNKGLDIVLYKDETLSGVRREIRLLNALKNCNVLDTGRFKFAKAIADHFAAQIKQDRTFVHIASHCNLLEPNLATINVRAAAPDFSLSIGGLKGKAAVQNRDLYEATRHLRGQDWPIIFLNVCFGAATRPDARSPVEFFLGWGAPAVISAPDLLNDSVAPLFSSVFYQIIADGLHDDNGEGVWLSEALYLTRRKIAHMAWEDRALIKTRKRVARNALARLAPSLFMVSSRQGDIRLSNP